MHNKLLIGWLLFFLITNPCAGQSPNFFKPADQFDQQRLNTVLIGTTLLWGTSMYFLSRAWYKKKVKFHAFNDNKEWLQMDKLGHAGTAYFISRGGYELMRWSGVNDNVSTLAGGIMAVLFQGTIEIFDGYSDGWGFSRGDMLANLAGATLFMGQQLTWREQKITMKYGWRKSIYPNYRSELLGKTTEQQFLKDYNAQHYWLSVNLASILPVSNDFPKWLNLSFGYSISGLTGGHKNPTYYDKRGQEVVFERVRQFYISPDMEFPRIEGNHEFKTATQAIQFLKFPAPSFEYNKRDKFRFNWLMQKD